MPEQQTVLYTAESLIDQGPCFRDAAEVQHWVDGLRETWWWEQWCSNLLKVEVEEVKRGTHGRRAAGASAYVDGTNVARIELHKGVPLRWQLLIHELAHCVAGARKGSQSHDPWFARIYLELTYLVRGRDSYLDLWCAFTAAGVDFDAEGLAPRVR